MALAHQVPVKHGVRRLRHKRLQDQLRVAQVHTSDSPAIGRLQNSIDYGVEYTRRADFAEDVVYTVPVKWGGTYAGAFFVRKDSGGSFCR